MESMERVSTARAKGSTKKLAWRITSSISGTPTSRGTSRYRPMASSRMMKRFCATSPRRYLLRPSISSI